MTEAVDDTWARIRQRNLERILAKFLETEKVPKALLEGWLDTSGDPDKVEQSIEAAQKVVDWLDGEYRP